MITCTLALRILIVDIYLYARKVLKVKGDPGWRTICIGRMQNMTPVSSSSTTWLTAQEFFLFVLLF